MSAPHYPFAALVAQPELKLALMLASVDWRLSVLLRGDKGSGKSTAARGLADILPAGAPFVNLPIGTTEDRLLGGLDLGQALDGKARLKRGLIHEAHGGVLYIDEVNLLADSLTDALLDVASSGRYYLERDGFSGSDEAQFIFLGSMNIEEGALRPQLLDRFALSLDVEAPGDAAHRALIVESRLRFDADPEGFCAAFEDAQQRLRDAVVAARGLIPEIRPPREILEQISRAVTEAGVRSLRADMAALRAAMTHAALAGRAEITHDDIEAVLPFVLHHRVKNRSAGPPNPPSNPKKPDTGPQEKSGAQDRVFPPEIKHAPELRMKPGEPISRGGSTVLKEGTQPKVDIVASFKQSFRTTGTAALTREHLIFEKPRPKSGMRFIFVVDASGSHAAHQRMRAVKGAAAALLESSLDNRDEVTVISFRGSKAEVVLPPCRDAGAALKALEFLPTGGRTPLAHALDLAGSLVNPASMLILLTDGRANVPLTTADAWADSLEAAAKLNCSCVLIDSSVDASGAGAIEELASAMRARVIHLDRLSEESLVNVISPQQ